MLSTQQPRAGQHSSASSSGIGSSNANSCGSTSPGAWTDPWCPGLKKAVGVYVGGELPRECGGPGPVAQRGCRARDARCSIERDTVARSRLWNRSSRAHHAGRTACARIRPRFLFSPSLSLSLSLSPVCLCLCVIGGPARHLGSRRHARARRRRYGAGAGGFAVLRKSSSPPCGRARAGGERE